MNERHPLRRRAERAVLIALGFLGMLAGGFLLLHSAAVNYRATAFALLGVAIYVIGYRAVRAASSAAFQLPPTRPRE